MAKQRTSKHETIPIDSSDVMIVAIENRMCGNCEEEAATKRVLLDVRNLGSSIEWGDGFCDACAPAIASELRAALPVPEEITEFV